MSLDPFGRTDVERLQDYCLAHKKCIQNIADHVKKLPFPGMVRLSILIERGDFYDDYEIPETGSPGSNLEGPK